MIRIKKAGAFIVIFFCALILFAADLATAKNKNPYKVYVMLGFHTSFYHSWRGDSNDEAGFGTDIRVVRGILKILNDANKRGQKARGYWDIDGYYTLERILPENAPDIIQGIRGRVNAGLDEVLPAPYNNGVVSAHTPDEMYRAISWTIENPWGSGIKQVFGTCAPIFRAQEYMTTTGMIPVLKRAGIEAIILPYSALPFTSISSFVKPLAPEERYGTFLLKHETGPETIPVIPAYNQADALDRGSFELWLRELRKLQTSGKVKTDLVLHYNMDADAEMWLPMKLPYGLSGLPNTGGLTEIIKAVNKYSWAEFTVPGEYLQKHPPTKTVLVRQDTADGAFDGYYSWAEKYQSHTVWTAIEKSRLYSYRADALLKNVAGNAQENLRKNLWADRDSSFWFRLLATSTTHFGMSTPIINEERQEAANRISSRAEEVAFEVYRNAAAPMTQSEDLKRNIFPYVVTVFNYPKSAEKVSGASLTPVRVPVIFRAPAAPRVVDSAGNAVHASVIDVRDLGDDDYAGDVTFMVALAPGESKTYNIGFDAVLQNQRVIEPDEELKNGKISLILSENTGVKSLSFGGVEIGKSDFLVPFINYKAHNNPKIFHATKWNISEPPDEYRDGVSRARLQAVVPIRNGLAEYDAKFTYTFTLYDNTSFLVTDVVAEYPYTPPKDLIQTVQQKLRRLLDLNWLEVGPFQIHPNISAPEQKPLTIWKHNYLGIVSSYDLDYGQINPKNRELDSFNHQITNGWVAMTDGDNGLLIAEDATVNSIFAFAPMRLRVKEKNRQQLYINPFGTYFGKQFDYSQLGGNGTGAAMTEAVGAHLRPSGSSWNGKTETFRLMLAPYRGARPPEETIACAGDFFYPYGVVYLRNPVGDNIVVAENMRAVVERRLKELAMKSQTTLPPPTALLANPADGAIDLVWDAPPDARIGGFEIRWKKAGTQDWKNIQIGHTSRYHISDLENGAQYQFSIRSLSAQKVSDWAPEANGVPGKVSGVSFKAESAAIPLSVILKLAKGILKHELLVH